MLTIHNISTQGGSAAAVAHYVEHARENGGGVGYYSEGNSAPSAWCGAGAAALGLAGPVDKNVLIDLLEGRMPDGTNLAVRFSELDGRRRSAELDLKPRRRAATATSSMP